MSRVHCRTHGLATTVLALALILPTVAEAGYKETFVAVLAEYYGGVCTPKLEGWGSKTLRLDWTEQTTKLHAVKVLSEVGDAKESLYDDGVRYLKFPNNSGGYNIIDWKTGEKKSVPERARYYFSD